MKERISLGEWSEEKIEGLLKEAPRPTEERIAFLSRTFLSSPYKEAPLSPPGEEVLVIDLEGFDCFTYLDTVEALRLSNSFAEFKKNLVRVRYKDGEVSYARRNHFFSDWAWWNRGLIFDATNAIGESHTRLATKTLNVAEDGSFIVQGIPPTKRQIRFVPSDCLPSCLDRLKTGDYIGIYTSRPGLDCCHVGIFIRGEGGLILRHASSRAGTVVDEDFEHYMKDKEGVVVLRPKDPSLPFQS